MPGVPETSFALPGEAAANHIHANVHFDSATSSTFHLLQLPSEYLEVKYADRSFLKILKAQDVVRVGDYNAMTRFGVIEHSESLEFRRQDGVSRVMRGGRRCLVDRVASHIREQEMRVGARGSGQFE